LLASVSIDIELDRIVDDKPCATANVGNTQIRSTFERYRRVDDPWKGLLPDEVAEV
jgi:hypothetical protein